MLVVVDKEERLERKRDECARDRLDSRERNEMGKIRGFKIDLEVRANEITTNRLI